MILKGRKLLMERLERVLKYIVCIHIHYHVQFHLNRSYDLRHTLGSFFVIMIVRQAPASGCNFIFFFFFWREGHAEMIWSFEAIISTCAVEYSYVCSEERLEWLRESQLRPTSYLYSCSCEGGERRSN